ncbi:MAG: hypothetical protein WC236_06860, partial [Gallionellaceae bacterium]
GFMLRIAFNGKIRHFFGGGRYRSAAIMTSGYAREGRNIVSEKTDFGVIVCHCSLSANFSEPGVLLT